MAAGRYPGFDGTGNRTIRSGHPENPTATLEPNMELVTQINRCGDMAI